MTDRMSAAAYLDLMRQSPSGKRGGGGGGRMLRLPADFLERVKTTADAPQAAEPLAAKEPKRVSSAVKARERVFATVQALEAARTEVDYTCDEFEHVVIRVVGGETLPPNRAANIGREQGKASQRTFSRYKHACADRMRDVAMLLISKVKKSGRTRFNSGFELVEVSYIRQVTSKSRLIDEDAVAYSFKWILDGIVAAGLLVDDSRRYVRIGTARQRIGDVSELIIELKVGVAVQRS